MTGLDGRTALVTGSTDGVGRAVATRLGEAGARVLVHGRDRERGRAVVAAIERAGGRADFLAADLAALAEVRRLAEAVSEGLKEARANHQAYDPAARAKLRALSEKLTR
jgi:NAD(P)-dependent dehydrogenase (short-subunit alcohol dehydrogenase family)